MKSGLEKKIKELEAEVKSLTLENKKLRSIPEKPESKPTVKVPEQIQPIFDKAEKTVGDYFKSLKFTPSKGTIEINEERYVLVRASALSHEFLYSIKNLYKDRGELEALNIGKNILFDLAHVIGTEDAHNFHKKMKLTDPISKLSAGPVHFAYAGWAFVDISPESKPSPDENYFLKYNHPFSFEADSWIRAKKKSNFPVCIMNAGYSSGWCEASFGITLTAVEITCRAKGDKHCTFIMAPPNKIDEYLKRDKKLGLRGSIAIPAFLERKKIEEELKSSEKHYREIFENASDMIQTIDLGGNILYVNDAWRKTLGFQKNEIQNKNIIDFIHQDYRDHCLRMMGALADGMMESLDKVEIAFITKTNKTVLVEGNINLRRENGVPVGTRAIFRNITEKKKAQEKVKSSLVEKEVLLKEIHHRVKNNLQIMSSLLNLQADSIKDLKAKEKYTESIGRIKSMAIIHELLYRSKNLSSIKIKDYVTELVNYISKTYSINPKIKVDFSIKVENEFIDLDKAIPCGIIINELLSNAFKYAYAKTESGKIKVEFTQNHGSKYNYQLIVSDHGIGMAKKIDFVNPSTLGLQLVHTLVEQIGGKMEVELKNGTKFIIKFP